MTALTPRDPSPQLDWCATCSATLDLTGKSAPQPEVCDLDSCHCGDWACVAKCPAGNHRDEDAHTHASWVPAHG